MSMNRNRKRDRLESQRDRWNDTDRMDLQTERMGRQTDRQTDRMDR